MIASSKDEFVSNAWPNRFHYFLLAMFFTALAVYGSLVPLNYTPLPLGEALERFSRIPFLSLGIDSRADWVSNILLFIPVSYLWIATLTVNSRNVFWKILASLAVVFFSTILSISIEFTQLWFPPRTVFQNDIFAETIGGIIGVALWLMIGQVLTEWIRSYTYKKSPKKKIDWFLEA